MRTRLGVLTIALTVAAGCSDPASRPDANQGIDTIFAETEILVTGVVTDGDTGAPIAGASIGVYSANGTLNMSDITTDAQGNYSFILETFGIAPYGYIRVTKTGYLDTFHWPGPLTIDVLGLGLVAFSTTQRDAVYGMAGRTADPSKLFVRVLVTDDAGPVAGAMVSSQPAAAATLATDANGVGYLLDAPPYLRITATMGAQSKTTLYLESYEHVGQLTVAAVALP